MFLSVRNMAEELGLWCMPTELYSVKGSIVQKTLLHLNHLHALRVSARGPRLNEEGYR